MAHKEGLIIIWPKQAILRLFFAVLEGFLVAN